MSVDGPGFHVEVDVLDTAANRMREVADDQDNAELRVLDLFHSGGAEVVGTSRTGNIQVRVDEVTGFNNNPVAGYLDQRTCL